MRSKFSIPFIDILFSFLLTFVCILSLTKNSQNLNVKAGLEQQAIYQVIMTWEGNSDIDLHGMDPAEHKVSFQRREGGEGSLFSLNRDSLGGLRTESKNGEVVNKINEEIVTIRAIYEGEYVFNGHDYRHTGEPVKVTARLIKVKPFKEIAKEERIFSESGEEYTFFRFTLNKQEAVSDLNVLPIKIVSPEEEEENENSLER